VKKTRKHLEKEIERFMKIAADDEDLMTRQLARQSAAELRAQLAEMK
jgi:hypothetical protein